MTKQNKNNKPRRRVGSKVPPTARSSSDAIQPCRRHQGTPSEGETSKTSTRVPAPGSGTSPNPTNEDVEISDPVSHIETASADMEMPNIGSQTTESTNEAFVSAPVGEQPPEAADATTTSPVSPGGTTPSDGAGPHSPSTEAQPETSVAAGDEQQASESEPPTTLPSQPDEAKDKSAEEDAGAGSQPSSGETQSEAIVTTDDEAEPMDFDTDMEMVLQMEKGRETSQIHDDDTEDGITVGGHSGPDASEREEDHFEENEEGQDDPETEQVLLSHIQEPPDGLRVRRQPSASNLTVAVNSQPSPAARDLLLQKRHLLGEDARISGTIASVANYIDGVGGMPSREEMEEFHEFRAFTAQRAKMLEEALGGGGEPLAAMQGFDERWRERSMDDAWGARQDLRLAAVRALLYFRHDFGSQNADFAILYFEHRVVNLRKKLGDDFDDPVALQTLDILGSAAGGR